MNLNHVILVQCFVLFCYSRAMLIIWNIVPNFQRRFVLLEPASQYSGLTEHGVLPESNRKMAESELNVDSIISRLLEGRVV